MAKTELDYMEYVNDAAAQAAYKGITHHPITFVGTAQLDTAQKKFGTASLLLDGNSDYLTMPDSPDWNFGTGDFTIDCWIRLNADQDGAIFQQNIDEPNRFRIAYDAGFSTIGIVVRVAGSWILLFRPTWNPALDTWYHFALVRSGDDWYIFIDGTQLGTTNASITMPDLTSTAYIGCMVIPPSDFQFFFNGWIEELRISKGIARWTVNFTPPSSPHRTDANTKLLLHLDGADAAVATIDSSRLESYSESTIKTQGSYSLKVVAAQTDSLNDTLTRTIS